MSNPKLKRPPPRLRLIREGSAAETWIPWRLRPPKGGESVRWECVDGRWLTVTMTIGDQTGVIIERSDGWREVLDSYEEALVVAKTLRD
jgi:hypothetical protein